MIKASALSCCVTILLFTGCKEATTVSNSQKSDSTTHIATYNYPRLQGTYRGDFDGSDISLVLRYVTGRHAAGYNIHKGLRRNMSGSMKPTSNGFSFTLSEPGDNPYDGVFNFTLDTSTLQITGNWKPADTRNLTEKEFVLKRDITDATADDNTDFFWTDSIGKIAFSANNMCIYRYYPKGRKQFIEINGNWKLQNNIYTIDWQPNSVFPSRRSSFKKQKMDGAEGTEDYEVELVGEGRTLWPEDAP